MSDEMSDEEFRELLRDTLRSEKDLRQLLSEEGRASSEDEECPPEAMTRMQRGFLTKVFRELHQELVRKIGRDLTFGRWIEAARIRAHMLREGIALALGRDVNFIAGLEKGTISPWSLSPDQVAIIIDLFGIQEDDFSRLLSISLGVSKAREEIQQVAAEKIAARAQGGRPSEERSEDIEAAIDMALAYEVGPTELTEEIKEWFSKVSEELQRIRMSEIEP
jgi:hypothetical protein